jgi:integrase/recombinase XerD
MAKKPSPNIYKRGNTFWCRFMVNRKEYRVTLRTSNEAVARRRAETKRDEIVAAVSFGEHRTLYDEAILAWTKEIVTNLAPSTVTRYMVSLKQLEPDLLGLYVDQIDKALISQIINRRRATGATNATIRRDLGALSSVLGFCDDHGWRDGNPALDRMRRLKERRDPIHLPDANDIERVASRAPGNLSALIRAALRTGCRQDELVTAKRAEFRNGQLTVIGKRNKRRTLTLSQEAQDVLRSIPPALGSPWLFHHGGEPYRNVASRFAELVRSARISAQKEGVEFRPFRFHDLRHLFAVNYLKQGGSIYRLKEVLGHTSVKTTEIYLEFLTPEERQVAMEVA